jgi:hypothetical protein
MRFVLNLNMKNSFLVIGRSITSFMLLSASIFLTTNPTLAEDTHSLASAAQNPIGSMTSVPFEYNGNFGVGELGKRQDIFIVEPVVPISLGDQWNLILRGILPLVNNPVMFSGDTKEHGLGDLTIQTFLTPKEATPVDGGIFTWGIGPTLQLDTASDASLGAGKNAAGIDAVVFWAIKPWTFGALVSNVWSFSGDYDRADVNAMTFEPFVNYNMKDGWYLTSSPILTANWEAKNSERWNIPLGGGIGRIFNIGKQPVNAQIQGFGYARTPTGGPDWSIRASLTFLFPE